MFTLHRWPRKRSAYIVRSGRPRSKVTVPEGPSRIINILEDLVRKGDLSESNYQTALWYQRTWHLYLSVIEAPRVKTTQLDPTALNGHSWSEATTRKIERHWRQAQEILNQQNPNTRGIVYDVMGLDQPCRDVKALKGFLEELDSSMRRNRDTEIFA
jgi:hypothetical protein